MAPGLPPGLDAFRKESVALARNLLWDIGDLDQTLESVLSQAARSAPAGSSDAELRRWLLRLTVLTVHGINRKRRPKRPASPAPEADLFDELRLEESYRQLLRNPEQRVPVLGLPLRNALAQLSDLDRSVFLLRSQCDLKYQEISDALDVPVGSVMGSLVRARIHLRRALAEQIHEV
jgi:RNA polymerase sigma-70 factor (ECF subfamily)